jgi:hypothetical protein
MFPRWESFSQKAGVLLTGISKSAFRSISDRILRSIGVMSGVHSIVIGHI